MSGVQLVWGSRSDVGLRRKINEDTLIADFPIFLVADGMGGHEAGTRRAGGHWLPFGP
ncbi:MAG: hypothetical protein IPL43_12165 [Micropruina sp.]|nr:hypothetical protein [Micropruina sp.]